MNDELGERIKSQYENRTRYLVPRRTYTIIRLDGKAFHTYTKDLLKPFDQGLSDDLDSAVIAILPEIQGSCFAYVQSDEISILLTDFALPGTCAWFDGNVQKMASVSASLMTAEFNKLRTFRAASRSIDTLGAVRTITNLTPAYFDSRIFTIPDKTEVMNYFIWRNQDCARNSVSMVAQSLFSHKELQGVSSAGMQEMMFKFHGINWAGYDEAKKNGRLIAKEEYDAPAPVNASSFWAEGTKRTKWVASPAWQFTKDPERLTKLIPNYT